MWRAGSLFAAVPRRKQPIEAGESRAATGDPSGEPRDDAGELSGRDALEKFLGVLPEVGASLMISRVAPISHEGVRTKGFLEAVAIGDASELERIPEYIAQNHGGGEYRLQWRQRVNTQFARGVVNLSIAGHPRVQSSSRNDATSSSSPTVVTLPAPAGASPDFTRELFRLVQTQLGNTQPGTTVDFGGIAELMRVAQSMQADRRDEFGSLERMLDMVTRLERFRGGGRSRQRNVDDDDDDDAPSSKDFGGPIGQLLMAKLLGDDSSKQQPQPQQSNRLPMPPPGWTWAVDRQGTATMVRAREENPSAPPPTTSSSSATPKTSTREQPDDDESDDDDTDELDDPMSVEELVDELDALDDNDKQRAIGMLLARMGLDPAKAEQQVAEKFPSMIRLAGEGNE